jgi:hypothetical protein
MEYACARCPWSESWDTPEAATSAFLWHLNDEHAVPYVMSGVNNAPTLPRPERLGHRGVGVS